MKPKPIRLRIKTADGRNREITLEDVVYLDVVDLVAGEVKFVIDLDTKWKEKLKVAEMPKV